MSQNDGAAYVYDSDVLVSNCQRMKAAFKGIDHYFDIRHMPSLSILYIIRNYLKCGMVVPSDEWRKYLDIIGVRSSDVHVLNKGCLWVERPDELRDICRANNFNRVVVPHELLGEAVLSCGSDVFSARSNLKVIVDAATTAASDLERDREKILKLAQITNASLGLVHGDNIISGMGSLWLRVRATKEIMGTRYVILSGGANVLWDVTRNGNAARRKYKISAAHADNDDDEEQVTFCGPLCTPQDTLAIDSAAPELLPGEQVVVKNVGCEFYHRSPIYFINHPLPTEFMLVGDDLYPLGTAHARS